MKYVNTVSRLLALAYHSYRLENYPFCLSQIEDFVCKSSRTGARNFSHFCFLLWFLIFRIFCLSGSFCLEKWVICTQLKYCVP